MPPLLGGWRRIAPYDALRIALALILLVAAALKGRQLATAPVAETDWFSPRWFLIAIVEFELAFGLWLLGGQFPRQTRRLTLFCFALFGGISLFRALRGDSSCGCFGAVSASPWLIAVVDGAAVLTLLIVRTPINPDAVRVPFVRRPRIPLIATIAVGVPAALLMARYEPASLAADGELAGDGGVIVLDPETWLGKPFPLSSHIDIGDSLSRGRWVLLFYHHDCAQCQQAVLRRERSARPSKDGTPSDSIALIEVPPLGSLPHATDGKDGLIYAHLDDSRDWFVATPLEVILDNGIVRAVRDATKLAPRGNPLHRRQTFFATIPTSALRSGS